MIYLIQRYVIVMLKPYEMRKFYNVLSCKNCRVFMYKNDTEQCYICQQFHKCFVPQLIILRTFV